MQGTEWLILILVIVFLLFGAKKIPELARSLGRAKGEYERGVKEVQQEIRDQESQDTAK